MAETGAYFFIVFIAGLLLGMLVGRWGTHG